MCPALPPFILLCGEGEFSAGSQGGSCERKLHVVGMNSVDKGSPGCGLVRPAQPHQAVPADCSREMQGSYCKHSAALAETADLESYHVQWHLELGLVSVKWHQEPRLASHWADSRALVTDTLPGASCGPCKGEGGPQRIPGTQGQCSNPAELPYVVPPHPHHTSNTSKESIHRA